MARQAKERQLEFHDRMVQVAPYGPEILLEVVAYSFYKDMDHDGKDASEVHDIIKFHSLAYHRLSKSEKQNSKLVMMETSRGLKRRRVAGDVRLRSHNIAHFNNSVEHVLMYKQKRVLRCLRSFAAAVKAIRQKIQLGKNRRVFNALARKWIL